MAKKYDIKLNDRYNLLYKKNSTNNDIRKNKNYKSNALNDMIYTNSNFNKICNFTYQNYLKKIN